MARLPDVGEPLPHHFETVDVRREGRTLQILLQRPEVRNAFDARMISELTTVFEEAAGDETLGCVLLRGDGPVFCSGADVNWMRAAADYSEEENREDARRLSRLFQAFVAVPCPTVAAIQGAAVGGGSGLVACADIAIAESSATFGFTEVRLGIIPAAISPFVLRKVPAAHARRYFATGETFDGQRAAGICLVSEAVPASELESRVGEVIEAILAVGPRASRQAKQLVDKVLGRPMAEVTEMTAGLIAQVRSTDEAREGLSAFLEKRSPAWREGEP